MMRKSLQSVECFQHFNKTFVKQWKESKLVTTISISECKGIMWEWLIHHIGVNIFKKFKIWLKGMPRTRESQYLPHFWKKGVEKMRAFSKWNKTRLFNIYITTGRIMRANVNNCFSFTFINIKQGFKEK